MEDLPLLTLAIIWLVGTFVIYFVWRFFSKTEEFGMIWNRKSFQNSSATMLLILVIIIALIRYISKH